MPFSPRLEIAYRPMLFAHFDYAISQTLLKVPLRNKKHLIQIGCQCLKSRNQKQDLEDARLIQQNCQSPVLVLLKVIVSWTRQCLLFLEGDLCLLMLTSSKYYFNQRQRNLGIRKNKAKESTHTQKSKTCDCSKISYCFRKLDGSGEGVPFEEASENARIA